MDQTTTPYGFIQDGKIYRNAFLEYPEREIGEVRESEASTIKYFEDRFEMARNKVAQLEQSVKESENKGSYLMKLIHMRESLAKFDALGDYPSLYERLNVIEDDLREIIAQNRVKNLEIKRALLAEAEPYESSSDWQEATDQLKEIKGKWIKTGAVAEEYQEEIEGRFNEILDTFFQRRKQFFEERKQMIYDRVRRYQDINNELYRLQRAPDREQALERAKELQAAWREVGKIPGHKYSKLFRNHKSLTNRLFRGGGGPGGFNRPGSYDRSGSGGYGRTSGYNRPGSGYGGPQRGGYREQQNWMSPDEAIAKKKDLISKAQALIDDQNVNTMEEVRQLRDAWKQSGRISRERSIELTETFNHACEKALETSFLQRLVTSRNPDFDDKNVAEQIQLKISLLSNLISRDEDELDRFKENSERFADSSTPPRYTSDEDRKAAGRLRSQIRKVRVKKELLSELQNELNKYL